MKLHSKNKTSKNPIANLLKEFIVGLLWFHQSIKGLKLKYCCVN